jgi:hypothetical protein
MADATPSSSGMRVHELPLGRDIATEIEIHDIAWPLKVIAPHEIQQHAGRGASHWVSLPAARPD